MQAPVRVALREFSKRSGVVLTVLVGAMLLLPSLAEAVPSFARQTGLACSQCHVIAFGPALTAYGRQFKLNGYVWGDKENPIKIPLAAMVVSTYSNTRTALPDSPADGFSNNNNFVVQETSLFYGGRISEHLGAFIQGTYSGVDKKASWDNLDVRYARTFTLAGKSLVAGISVNNNPTVQDLWNSTPAWSFPYMNSELVPAPSAAPLVLGGLAQNVLGATAYAMINDRLYLEAGLYRGLSDKWLGNVGLTADDSAHLWGAVPYVRATLQKQWGPQYVAAGVFGLNAKVQPDPTVSDTDRYTDYGADITYQYSDGVPSAIHANASWVHEDRHLAASFAGGGSDALTNHIDTFQINVGYAYRQTWVTSLGLFDINGTSNSLLFAPDPVDGSASGSPASRGYTVQLEVVPFTGGGANYDGSGRAASDNNTLFAFAWLAF